MKEGWKYEKLKNICNILNGFAFKSSKYVSEGIRVIRIANVQKSCVIDSQPKFYPSSELPNIKNYLLQEGDLLMSLTGNVGRVGFIDATLLPAALNQRVACLRLKTTHINIRYLYHYLNSDLFENICIANSTGAAQLNMSTVWLANHIIPLPPLSEQERIVSLLDAEFAKIDAIKANAEKQLQEAKALFQSILCNLLSNDSWTYSTIGEIFKTYSGGTPHKSNKDYYEHGSIPWINSGEVCQKYIETTNNFITEKGLKNSSAKYYPVNTVLIAMYGATAAQSGILKFEATSNQAVCGLLPNQNYVPEFVYYWFVYNKEKVASMAQGGAQPNLSQVKIKTISIPLISLDDQQQIATQLDKLSAKIQSLQSNFDTTVTLCNDLKQSILKDIFG